MQTSLPSIDDVLHPVLVELGRGRRNSRECMPGVVEHFGLGEAALRPPADGGKPRIMSRIAWALVSLQAAGLVSKVAPGSYAVTEAGRKLLDAPRSGSTTRI